MATELSFAELVKLPLKAVACPKRLPICSRALKDVVVASSSHDDCRSITFLDVALEEPSQERPEPIPEATYASTRATSSMTFDLIHESGRPHGASPSRHAPNWRPAPYRRQPDAGVTLSD